MDIVPVVKPEKEIHAQVKQKQEYKFIGSIRMIRGLKLYSFNTSTFKLKVVEIQRKVSVGMEGEAVKHNKAQYNPKLIYVQALNEKNAARKVASIIDAHNQSKHTN